MVGSVWLRGRVNLGGVKASGRCFGPSKYNLPWRENCANSFGHHIRFFKIFF